MFLINIRIFDVHETKLMTFHIHYLLFHFTSTIKYSRQICMGKSPYRSAACVVKGKWQQNFLSAYLKETPKQYREVYHRIFISALFGEIF